LDIRLGEQAQASKEVIKIQNVGELHTEAQVSEADIASVTVGQNIDYTFDALGPDKHFTSKVLTVNPASTVVSGVVNYKVTGSLQNIPEVKPGMTANMTILVAKKPAVLVVPSSAIINKSGKKFVRVINDPKLKTFVEVEVTTGLEADGGLVEILSGLVDGQSIITYMK
jgi:HlyD family secretion protein